MTLVADLGQLKRDTHGVTIVEFGMCAPVLLMAMMGVFDLGYNMYTSAMLQGAVQQAARGSTIEGAAINQATLDRNVTTAVHAVAPQAALTFERRFYTSFSDVSRAEDFTDLDGDGACDNGEPFEDANANARWDADRGTVGVGGARDAVLYVVTITYPRAFPVAGLIPGQTNNFTMESKTVLRNQPFAAQAIRAATTGNCT